MTCLSGTLSSDMLFNKVLSTDADYSTVPGGKLGKKGAEKISLGGIKASIGGNINGVCART